MSKHFLLFGLSLLLTFYCISCQKDPVPITKFSYTPDNPTTNDIVQFRSISQDLPNYHWDFGNGQTSTEASPKVRYTQSGPYYVTLTSRSSGGLSSTTSGIRIEAPLVVDFTFPNTNFIAPATVTFTNLCAPSSRGFYYNWDFGNGKFSIYSNPTTTFETSGTYVVRLRTIFMDRIGDSVVVKTITVQ